jgi:hypothetical protein
MLYNTHWLIRVLISIAFILTLTGSPGEQPTGAAQAPAILIAPNSALTPNAGPLGMGTPANTATPTPPLALTWAPNTTYLIGQQVQFEGISYRCLRTHTSRIGLEPPNAPALWQPIQATSGPTPTRTPTPSLTPTNCPQPTAEPLWVEPVTSPTDQLSQEVTVRIGNGEAVTITVESGIFTTTGTFNASANPARITVKLLPNVTHHLHVTARVRRVGSPGGCQYGGYTLSTDRDRQGAPLTIVQQSRALPDLIVARINLIAVSGVTCGVAPFRVRVELANVGAAPAGPFVVDLNGARQTIAAGLGAGQRTAVLFQGPRSGIATAFVDAALQVAEQREDNNRLTTILPVSDPLPPCTPTPSR